MHWMAPDQRRLAITLLLVAFAAACAAGETELQRTHIYMDSLRVYLGELRRMDHDLNKVVTTDTLAADVIVPLIAERFRPTVADLRRRASAVTTTATVDSAHGLLLRYLDMRLQAYDAAIRGRDESRPELYEEFAHRQIEAQILGDDLEDLVQALRTSIPGYY